MIALADLRAAWEAFWFAPASPLPVALYRIALGLLALASGLMMAPEWLMWMGDRGVLDDASALLLRGPDQLDVMRWLPAGDGWRLGFLAVHLLAAASLAVGLATRTSAAVLWLTLTSMHHHHGLIFNAGDGVMRLMAFYLAFSRAGDALSVDRWLAVRAGRAAPGEPPPSAPWAQRLMQVQVSAIYFFAFWAKADGPPWLDGTAVWYALMVPEYQRFPAPLPLGSALAVKAATWGSMALELALGTLVWIRELRYPLLAAGVAFHLVLEWSMNLPIFQWLMIAGLVLFVDPEDLRAVLARRRSAG